MLHGDVAELEGILYEIALFLVEGACVGHVLDDVIELLLGDGDLPVALCESRSSLADGREELRERLENAHKKAQRTCGVQAQPLAVSLCRGFGEHLAEEKEHKRRCDGAPHGCAHAEPARYEDRDDGGGAQMDDIRPDEDRRDREIEFVQHLKGALRTCVAPLAPGPQARTGYRGESRFRGGKIYGAGQKKDQRGYGKPTAIIHRG